MVSNSLTNRLTTAHRAKLAYIYVRHRRSPGATASGEHELQYRSLSIALSAWDGPRAVQ